MVDVSIIELIFYGTIELASILVLIISAIKKDQPTTKSSALLRAIYLIPGMITAGLLAGVGVNIDLDTIFINATRNELVYNATNDLSFTTVVSDNSTQIRFIPLQEPVWGMFHLMIMFVLAVHVITQLLNLFTKTD